SERTCAVSIHAGEAHHFRSGGKGGQNQNKRDTGTRVIHHPSGARGESREERSQLQNKRAAFLRMINSPKFQLWLAIETGGLAVIQSELDQGNVPPEELLIETRHGGRWVPAPHL